LPAKAKLKKNLSVLKRTRQSIKRSVLNKAVRTSLKTLVKKVESAVSSGNREEANRALKETIRALSTAASKGIIHKNNASRRISNLTKRVKALSKAEAA
jgi:small subunit ribosomal protein S20